MAKNNNKEVITMKKVACTGILVADIIVEPVSRYPEKGVLLPVNSITIHNGGNAMTASLNIKKLGVETAIIGMVGNDMYGQFLNERLKTNGVDTTGLITTDKAQTSASVLMIDKTGERSFFHCKGANAVLRERDINYDIIKTCDIVFVTGSFLLDSFDGEDTMIFLRKCKEMGKTTFLDVCWDASEQWGKLLNMSMPYIDYFMPSIDEAVRISSRGTPEEIADEFIEKGVKNVIIKMGGKGSFFKAANSNTGSFYPSFNIENPVDTTGAGDSFCSGFITAYAKGMSTDECMVFANATGALCVTEKGATTGIKSFEETIDFIKKEQEKC